MTDFVGDPDFTLRWPPEVFVEEAERLVRRGTARGAGHDWAEEVDLLLRQAFTSAVPADDFKQIMETATPSPTYGNDDEPF